MDVSRAQEILASEQKINVELNGMAIWIDSVNLKKKTAKIHAEENPAHTRTVTVDDLQEVH